MSQHIMRLLAIIAGPTHHLALYDDDCADRNFTFAGSLLSQVQGELHKLRIPRRHKLEPRVKICTRRGSNPQPTAP